MNSYVIERTEKYAVIRTKSEKLDTSVAPSLKSEFVLLNTEGVKNVIVDLSETRYCDSSGLSAILVGNRLCKNANGGFVITGLQDSVKKLITISQLDSILSIAPNFQESISMVLMEAAGK